MPFMCCPECPGDQSCPHAEVCMCGSYVKDHGMGDGHSPVSMHNYYGREIVTVLVSTSDGYKEWDRRNLK